MDNEKQLKIYFDMLREFFYEKNGLDESINFLEIMLFNLKGIRRKMNGQK